MTNDIVNMLLLSVITTYIVGVSGFTQSWRGTLAGFLHTTPSALRRLRPFDCETCMTWWTCIVYLICVRRFTVPGVAVAALCSLLSFPLSQFMIFIREALLSTINKAIQWIQR